jgi:hypothetical protein
MKIIIALAFMALSYSVSAQTITSINYVVNGKVKARTTTIKIEDSIVHINGTKRRLNKKTYTVTNREGKIVGLCAGRRYYSTSILKATKKNK